MPTHRRNTSKLVPSTKCHTFNDDRDNGFPLNHGLTPKHVTLPTLSKESEFLYEGQLLILFTICLAAQSLNLYRTVWWLSQSNVNAPINVHLIDFNVVVFSFVLVAVPFFQHLCNSISSILPEILRQTFAHLSSFIVLIVSSILLLRSAYFIYLNHGLNGLCCVSYPAFMYLLIYFPDLLQAYTTSKQSPWSVNIHTFLKALIVPKQFSKKLPVHTCYTNPSQVRGEILEMKNLFNERLKFILFRSLLVSYYSTFVPICLANPNLVYDTSLARQFCFLSWISAFLMYTSYLYSPHFYDILHKSSLHLGKWQKLETRNSLVPCNSWSENAMYSQGVVIKYSKEYFKAEGIVNCAEPTNQSHLRYYIVFSSPVGGFGTLLGLLMTLIVVQIFLLVRSSEWYKLISITLLIIVNLWTVFRLIRAYHVLKEVYKVESHLQDGNQSNYD